MKNRTVIYSIRIIEMLLQVIVFSIGHALVLIGFFSQHQESVGFCFLVMGVPAVILYLTRLYINNNLLTVLAHIVSAAFVILVGRTDVQIFACIIAGAAQIIYSILICINDNRNVNEKMPLGMAAVFVTAMFMGSYMDVEKLSQAALYTGVAFIILQVIYFNLNNMYDIMEMNNDTNNFPLRQMLSVNSFIMTIVLALCGGAMLISNNTYVYKMIKAIGDLLLIVIRFILGIIVGKPGEISGDIETQPEVGDNNGGMFLPMGEKTLLTDILNGLAMVVSIVVAVLIIIVVAVAVVRLFKRMKGGDGVEGDVKEFVAPEDRVFFNFRRKKEEAEAEEAANAKARKLYKNIAKKGAAKRGRKVAGNMMPETITNEYIPNTPTEVTYIYEKARYSNMEVTKEEIDYLKKVKKSMS